MGLDKGQARVYQVVFNTVLGCANFSFSAYWVQLCRTFTQPERVQWGPEGKRYILQLTARMLQVQTLEEAKEKVQIEFKDPIMEVKFYTWVLLKLPYVYSFVTSENEFAIGLASGMIELWHIEKGNNARDVGVKTRSFQAHQARIKGMAICNDVLFTGDSTGVVKGHTKKGKCIFEEQTDARITCLTVTDVNSNTENGTDDQRLLEENVEDIKKSSKVSKISVVLIWQRLTSSDNSKSNHNSATIEGKQQEKEIERQHKITRR